MIKVAFVCHGNICRSPMAEFIFKAMVKKEGLQEKFEIVSLATSNEEVGNSVYPPVARLLSSAGIDCSKKRAVQLDKSMYDSYNYFIGMDNENVWNLKRIFGTDEKIYLLYDFLNQKKEVDDPWYTRDFHKAYEDISTGLIGLLQYFKKIGI